MRRNFIKNKFESGQVIPLVVLMMFAIIGMVALILDGGSIMTNKRTAQAAADAGALAGAKQLCSGNIEEAKANATTAATSYITKNKAALEALTFPNVNISGYAVPGISVKVAVQTPSFFAGIFGVPSLTARAEASAGCYHPSITTHLLPIAFYYQQPPVKSDETDCTDITKPCDIVNWDYTALLSTLVNTQANDLPLNKLYVIMDNVKICDKNVSGTWVCNEMAANSGGGNRAWIDITLLSEGNNPSQVIKYGVSKPLALPSWLNGDPGTIASTYGDAVYTELPPITGYESFPFRLVLVPVFDNFCQYGDPDIRCQDKWTVGDTTEYIRWTSKPSYRLVGLGPFVITCVTKNKDYAFGVPVPANTGVNQTNKPQCPGYALYLQGLKPNETQQKDSIEGYFVDGSPLDDFTGGTEGVSAGLDVISLTK